MWAWVVGAGRESQGTNLGRGKIGRGEQVREVEVRQGQVETRGPREGNLDGWQEVIHIELLKGQAAHGDARRIERVEIGPEAERGEDGVREGDARDGEPERPQLGLADGTIAANKLAQVNLGDVRPVEMELQFVPDFERKLWGGLGFCT